VLGARRESRSICEKFTEGADVEQFVRDHRPYGGMSGDATEPATNGYRLTVACACGVVFERGHDALESSSPSIEPATPKWGGMLMSGRE